MLCVVDTVVIVIVAAAAAAAAAAAVIVVLLVALIVHPFSLAFIGCSILRKNLPSICRLQFI